MAHGKRLAVVLTALLLLIGGLARVMAVSSPKQAQGPSLADVRITQCWYGGESGTGKDVTDIVLKVFNRGDASMPVNNGVFTDTAPDQPKTLWIEYTLLDKEYTYSVREGGTLSFSNLVVSPTAKKSITVLSATYHDVDVTNKVSELIANGANGIPVECSALGISDPAPGVPKILTIRFELEDGTTRVLTGRDGEVISLATLMVLPLLPTLANGSFDSMDRSSFLSEMTYAPAGQNVLSRAGTFTISEGILRPFQLDDSIRADFVQHTGRQDSMAMWVNPPKGRQPMLIWEEKVSVEPNSDYSFSCFISDISDSLDLFATVVLEVDSTRSRPVVLIDLFHWIPISMKVHSGTSKQVTLKVWRDVIPYGANGGAALGVDDITFRRTGTTGG